MPLLLDDAAGIPPIENLKLYAKMGADLYCFSGGKGLCGPQCSGLATGAQGPDRSGHAEHQPVGRRSVPAMKVGKEEIMGCLAAIEAWTKMDLNALNREWNAACSAHSEAGRYRSGRDDRSIQIPEGGNRYPTLNGELG